MAKKKVMFMLPPDINDDLKIASDRFRVSKSEIVTILLEKFIPILAKENDVENIPKLLLFDTDHKNFDSVGSLFHEK